MNLVEHILTAKISNQQKLLMIALTMDDGYEIDILSLSKYTGSTPVQILANLATLGGIGFLIWNFPIVKIGFNNQTYSKVILSSPEEKQVTRKAVTKTDLARRKLESMRLVGFVGSDLHVYQLSKEYDALYKIYYNKNIQTLPPNSIMAKSNVNWKSFKTTYEKIIINKYNSRIYLKSQFEAIKYSKFNIPLFPSMLASTWAEKNYAYYASKIIDNGMSIYATKSETQLLTEVMESSYNTISSLMEANKELSLLEAIMISLDSLSPVYLVCVTEYIKFINETEQSFPDGVVLILQKFERDTKYKTLIFNIYNQVVENDREV